MSRLDKQLDRLSGEKLIRIDWPDDGAVDAGELRRLLVREIDTHTHRIPLDLRGVKGAPEPLVEMLVDLRRYALSQNKILSTSWILPPLRDALDDRMHRPVGTRAKPSAAADTEAASELADELLRGVEEKTQYDLSKAERIERKCLRRKRRQAWNGPRALRLAAVILAAAVAVIAIEWVLLSEEDAIVVVPEKGFENHSGVFED
jgi:hypothetical protein